MPFLTDYYSGQVGAGALDWRDQKEMITRGEPLRYAPEDIGWLTDYQIREMVDKQGAQLDIPQMHPTSGKFTGKYQRLDNPEVGPGGWKTISAGEAVARGRNAAAGGRALEDPAGLVPQYERQIYNTAQSRALSEFDVLSQYMDPAQARAEASRRTGFQLPTGLSSPNQEKRAKAEADLVATRASAAKTAEEAEAKRLERVAAPLTARSSVDTVQEALDDTIKEAKRLQEHAGAYIGTGLTGAIASKLPISSEAKDFQLGLEAFKGKIALNTIQALKAASATGATGFGALSEGELKVLQNSFGALDKAQTYDEVRRVLADIQKVSQKQMVQTERKYQTEFGKRAAPSGRLTPDAPGAGGAPQLPQGIPPAAQRPPGLYPTPQGQLYWTGQGWTQPTGEQLPQQQPQAGIGSLPLNPAAAGIELGRRLIR